MSAIVEFTFSVAGVVTALLIAVIWLQIRPGSIGVRKFLTRMTIGFTAASLYFVPYAASRILVLGNHQLIPSDLPLGRTAVVVLGAGDHLVLNWNSEPLYILDIHAAARVWEAFRVYRSITDGWVISSGGAVGSQPGARPSALTMRDAMIRFGIPPSRILVEDQSQNTRDEAVLIEPMLRSLNVDHVILVTSDIHMRRSLGAFRAVGVPVIPAIARDPFFSYPWRRWIVPSRQGFELTGAVVHEFVGIGYYAARGWFRLS